MDEPLPDRPRKGRGAVGNRTSRFERLTRHSIDDGWNNPETDDPPRLATTILPDTAKSVINTNQSPDIPFDLSVNPYRGCEHGCVYCYARPSHAYLGLSPGLDFESRLFAKFDAPDLLERELLAPSYRCRVIAMGSNTDCYQPIEREYLITRRLLEVMAEFNQPVMLTTKSALVTRDLDILSPMAARGLAHICVSVTTLDPGLSRRLEPRASAPHRRLDAIRQLTSAGVPVSVMASPMIPAVNDTELESILEAARDAGATGAAYLLLRLPGEIMELMEDWLAAHFPARAAHVLSLIRDCRGGRLNDPRFKTRFTGEGPYADLLRRRFHLACRRLGLIDRAEGITRLDPTQFRRPPRAGDQLSLL